MKAIKMAVSIVLWILFIILAIIAVRYLILGGFEECKAMIQEKGFWEFLKWFFESMWSGGNYVFLG